MGMLKEVFVDRTIDGEELPSNLLWVGTLGASDPIFSVPSSHPSMNDLVLNFGSLIRDQEEAFASVLLRMRYV
jgi:hypothetical protein